MIPNTPQPVSTATPTAPARFPRPLEVGIVVVVAGLDQLTKWLVRMNLPLWDQREIIPGFLNLVHVQNTGAAFGLLNNVDFPYKSAVMIGIAALALIAIAAYATQLGFHERAARLGLAFILGGAIGNLLDRSLFGHVVDFIDVYWGSVHFWAFNVADAAITAGAILVLLDILGFGRHHAPDSV
ncbi:MAG: signal peptidase II [Acidobacteria bacterium]|nr:signal peptidase II [Acidobacteriota bacterium]